MGIDAIYTVWCDADDCPQWIGEEPRKRMAVEDAREAGWVRRRLRPGVGAAVGWVCPIQREDVCGEIYNGPTTQWCLLKPNHDGPHDWANAYRREA
jgi:hypothetical protein